MSDSNDRVQVQIVMEDHRREDVYPPEVIDAIDRIADLSRPFLTAQQLASDPAALRTCDVLLTGWGAPVIDEDLLARAPRLRAVLHAAGSVKHMVTEAAWDRGVTVVSAAAANAEPVAEITAAQIVLAARGIPASRRAYRNDRSLSAAGVAHGATGQVVGLLALGEIGRRVAERLRSTSFTLVAHDPFADHAHAAQLGVELVELDELFERSDVISLHAPLLPATTGMIGRNLLLRMPHGATLINTARGALIDEAALVEVLGARPDLTALLDATTDEPPAADSAMWTMENIELTPHVAGSMGADRSAMGRLVARELERLIQGRPLHHQVTREASRLLA